jgi:formate--tetrahydrofolate ligase
VSGERWGELRPTSEVAADMGLDAGDVIPHGAHVAKVSLDAFGRPAPGKGRLVLVSAMTPSRLGEGKTTTSVGLCMGLRALGRRATVCLREPSLGPVFGRKGGGTGGGRAQVIPADRINLHFTGDMHAIACANNLLAALIDNGLHFGTTDLDPNTVSWRRVLDMNDRALRHILIGLGGREGGVLRETGFDISAASEVMAALCLAGSPDDLEARLRRIVIGRAKDGRYVTAEELGAAAPMAVLLKDALLPNLVQTMDGGPALVHGGAFANLAHGCSSSMATRLAMHYADDVVTEAGFGFELGGEKFLHIKCPSAGIWPRCVVLTVTLRGLKVQGGVKTSKASAPDSEAIDAGVPNLEHHLAGVRRFGLPAVVALNVFDTDTHAELAQVEAHCARLGVPVARCDAFARGSEGARALAEQVAPLLDAEEPPQPTRLYPIDAPYAEKLEVLATQLYNAAGVEIESTARRKLRRMQAAGYADLPVCVAKTPLSLSDNPKGIGVPSGFLLTVRDAQLAAGSGMVVALTGTISTMPGLPKRPNALRVRLEDGRPRGLMQGD